jgi:threonine/homoserine/homoserine lactone efflux protein
MPVEAATLAAFIAASLAIILSPGPDTMLILRYTMTSGQRTGLATVTGVQLGLIVHTVAAAVGLSLIIASSDLLFRAIAIAGAAYLGWLGLQGFRAGLLNVATMTAAGAHVSAAKGLRDAMLTNILNPKVILLFLALMPNFVIAGRGQVPLQLALFGVALIAVNTVWQVALALGAERARRWLGRPAVQRAVSRGTGLVLLGFAAILLVEHVL